VTATGRKPAAARMPTGEHRGSRLLAAAVVTPFVVLVLFPLVLVIAAIGFGVLVVVLIGLIPLVLWWMVLLVWALVGRAWGSRAPRCVVRCSPPGR